MRRLNRKALQGGIQTVTNGFEEDGKLKGDAKRRNDEWLPIPAAEAERPASRCVRFRIRSSR